MSIADRDDNEVKRVERMFLQKQTFLLQFIFTELHLIF
jgi:hypothetical protein